MIYLIRDWFSWVGDLDPNVPLFQENGVVWEGTRYRIYQELAFQPQIEHFPNLSP